MVSRTMMNKIRTFVFLDLETTGLPFYEQNKTKITELTLVSVLSEHLSLGTFPRVQNKLSLCFNPRKLISYESERMTGLSNDRLEHLGPFSSKTVDILNLFLEHHPEPICLVAHNGNGFDFPILQAEINKTGTTFKNDILCIDSLDTFRDLHHQEIAEAENEKQSLVAPDSPDSVPLEFQDGFDELLCSALDEYEKQSDPTQMALTKAREIQKINETTPKKPKVNGETKRKGFLEGETLEAGCSKKPRVPASKKNLKFGLSFKLGDVYMRLTKSSEVVDAHTSEGDVKMLLMCAATLGDKFITWSNEKARNFSDVPPMTPGRKIGT